MVSSGVIRNFRSVVVPPSRQARQLPMHSLAVSGAAKRREYELSTVIMSRVDSELLGPEGVYSATERTHHLTYSSMFACKQIHKEVNTHVNRLRECGKLPWSAYLKKLLLRRKRVMKKYVFKYMRLPDIPTNTPLLNKRKVLKTKGY